MRAGVILGREASPGGLVASPAILAVRSEGAGKLGHQADGNRRVRGSGARRFRRGHAAD